MTLRHLCSDGEEARPRLRCRTRRARGGTPSLCCVLASILRRLRKNGPMNAARLDSCQAAAGILPHPRPSASQRISRCRDGDNQAPTPDLSVQLRRGGPARLAGRHRDHSLVVRCRPLGGKPGDVLFECVGKPATQACPLLIGGCRPTPAPLHFLFDVLVQHIAELSLFAELWKIQRSLLHAVLRFQRRIVQVAMPCLVADTDAKARAAPLWVRAFDSWSCFRARQAHLLRGQGGDHNAER